MAVVCSCDYIVSQDIKNYLVEFGPVQDEKSAKRARAYLHKQKRIERLSAGLNDRTLCASCVLRLLLEIMKESRVMYPEAHKEAA